MAKKGKHVSASFECMLNDWHFVRIFESMYKSTAFKELNDRQKVLYLYAKTRYKRHTTEYRDDELCYLNWHWAKETMNRTNSSQYYDDIDVLIAKGFLDCYEQHYHKASVFRFSDRWKKYGTDYYVIPDSAKTNRMKKKEQKEFEQKEKEDKHGSN